jgi:hypothetical protein
MATRFRSKLFLSQMIALTGYVAFVQRGAYRGVGQDPQSF